MIHVVTPWYNAALYLRNCIYSLQCQCERDWRCFLVDDLSTDHSCDVVEALTDDDRRFTYLQNREKLYVAGSYRRVLLSPEIADDDIIVCLDGDDLLPDSGVLSRIKAVYSDPNVWITWGSYKTILGRRGLSKPVQDVTKVRNIPWATSHLRTFRAFLFRNILPQDLLGSHGRPLEAAGDCALMFPMLEMATNSHARFLPEINYVYNSGNPLCEYRTKRNKQIACERSLRNRPRYPPLTR